MLPSLTEIGNESSKQINITIANDDSDSEGHYADNCELDALDFKVASSSKRRIMARLNALKD